MQDAHISERLDRNKLSDQIVNLIFYSIAPLNVIPINIIVFNDDFLFLREFIDDAKVLFKYLRLLVCVFNLISDRGLREYMLKVFLMCLEVLGSKPSITISR